MSEPAHLAGMLAPGGRHGGWAPACGTVTLRAAIAVLTWPERRSQPARPGAASS